MVLFSTQFALSDDLTQDEFIQMMAEWLSASQNYSIEVAYDGKPEYAVESADGKEKLSIYASDERLAAQLVKQASDAVFTNTYVMNRMDGKPVMFIQLTKEMLKVSITKQQRVNIPKLMREIFWREYGGMDDDIMTDDKSRLMRKQDINMAKKIVMKEGNYINPVVYISPFQSTGKYGVDYEELASELLGIAHVLVEASPYVSKLVGKETGESNPQNGAVEIFFPDGNSKQFTGKETNLNEVIVDYVRSAAASVVVPDVFSFQKIRLEHMLGKAGANSEISQLCDQLLSEKDHEVQQLKQEIDELKSKLSKEASRSASLQEGFKKRERNDMDVVLTSAESDLYPGERADVILKVLQKEKSQMEDDHVLQASRKFHVLSDLIENNPLTGTDETIRETYKKNVQSGTFSSEGIHELERLGFSVVKGQNSHFKVAYAGDDRYQAAVSCSPSDCRAGSNAAADYMNRLFGC